MKKTASTPTVARFTALTFFSAFFFTKIFRTTAAAVTATAGRRALKQKSTRRFEPVPAIGEVIWKTIWSKETSGQT